jgi:hypothetical protein
LSGRVMSRRAGAYSWEEDFFQGPERIISRPTPLLCFSYFMCELYCLAKFLGNHRKIQKIEKLVLLETRV